jgi:hypothetical protein
VSILQIDSCWVLEISHHIPCTNNKVIAAYEGEHLSNIQVYELKHIINKVRICVIKVTVSQAQIGFMDQRCSEIIKFVTTKWDI